MARKKLFDAMLQRENEALRKRNERLEKEIKEYQTAHAFHVRWERQFRLLAQSALNECVALANVNKDAPIGSIRNMERGNLLVRGRKVFSHFDSAKRRFDKERR